MKAEYEVVVGDWNVRHPEGAPNKNAADRRNTAVSGGLHREEDWWSY